MQEIGKRARLAQHEMLHLTTQQKNIVLSDLMRALSFHESSILSANQKDVLTAIENKLSKAFIDRLTLTESRIINMMEGIRTVISLPDPIGTILEHRERPNGLIIEKKVVPLGVVGIIYEARPNVTVDSFAVGFKSSNVVILRGGKEAIESNKQLVQIIRQVIANHHINPDVIQLVEDTTRESSLAMMHAKSYIDVLIPRGGQGLIQTVVNESTVPVIETGAGNCHVYIDADADIEKAVKIAYNSKVRRPSVCNACETILVHETVKEPFLKGIQKLFLNKVEIRGDEQVLAYIHEAKPVTDLDYATEFLDYIVAMRVVPSFEEAVAHIDRYSTKHSEAIVTESHLTAERFLNEVDAAAVYVNAPTSFTDGGEFGMGVEIGISTQKLHARGPMGLNELTSYKYVIRGQGQVRE